MDKNITDALLEAMKDYDTTENTYVAVVDGKIYWEGTEEEYYSDEENIRILVQDVASEDGIDIDTDEVDFMPKDEFENLYETKQVKTEDHQLYYDDIQEMSTEERHKLWMTEHDKDFTDDDEFWDWAEEEFPMKELNEAKEPLEYKFNLHNAPDNDVWILGDVVVDGITYEINAKVFLEGSNYGIDNGPVSILWVKDNKNKKVVINYSRGWDIKPADEYYEAMCDMIVSEVTKFRNAHPYKIEERIEEAIKQTNDLTVYVGKLELDYTLVSVGNTEDEAIKNLIDCFTDWANNKEGSVENWVTNIAGVTFSNYDNDIWKFLNEYYGAYIQEVNNYAVFGM